MQLKAIAFDWGHTVMDENRDREVPLDVRPIHLMPGVSEMLPHLAFPLALWANTRLAREADVRACPAADHASDAAASSPRPHPFEICTASN